MKKLVAILLCCFAFCMGTMAQNADAIVGNYKASQNGSTSKVKIFKQGNGYRAQIFWVDKPNNPDGTPKTDVKNPDPAKRSVKTSEIVLIDNVVYDAKKNVWNGGKIYDPTSGKTYKVELSIKDSNTLIVKGMLGPFSKKISWTRL